MSKRTRKFRNDTVLASLPGSVSAIAAKSGFHPETVRRSLVDLLAERRAYQDGWLPRAGNRGAPTYAPGVPPDDFQLAPRPVGVSAEARRQKYRTSPKGRAKVRELSRAAAARKADVRRDKKRAYWEANRDRLNKSRRDKAAASRAKMAKHEAAIAASFLQLTGGTNESDPQDE